MNLLERYLKQIEKYLPIKDRKDTIMELRSLLLEEIDMETEKGLKYEDAMYIVIKNWGEPREIASKYGHIKPIISKEFEPILMFVVKIMAIVIPLVVFFASMLGFLVSNDSFTFGELMLQVLKTIPNALYSFVTSLGFVFLIFISIQRLIGEVELPEKHFDPNLLPDIPEKEFRVSLFESIFTIIMTLAFMTLINIYPEGFAVYYDGTSEPLLNDNFLKVLPYMNIGWVASILIQIYYVYKRRKNFTTKTIEFIHAIYSAIVLFILATSDVFNNVLVEGLNFDFFPNLFRYLFIGIGVIIIIASIVDYVKLFINLEHLEELDKQKKEARK